jgi:L-2,4-diaminobutyrate decarboxylase
MAFLDDARRTAEALAAYDDAAANRRGAVLQQPAARELQDRMDLSRLSREGGLTGDRLSAFLDAYLDGTIVLRDPRNMGHQTAIPSNAGAFGAFVDGYATNPMAINEMGPAATAIELFYLDWMLGKVGWSTDHARADRAGGVLTHGGSLANLTALAAARAAVAPDAWRAGNPSNLVIIAPAAAHYSIARAAGIMGLGQAALIVWPVDGYGRARADLLADLIDTQTSSGKTVMAVVANACQTAAGLYDPLRQIGEICERAGIWFHVDGAHGAGALLSPRLAHLMDGVELADSLIWDAHKMLRTPCICAAVLVRDQRRLDAAFAQDASYIFHEKENPGFDFVGRAVECTKASLGLKAFMALAEGGEAGLATHVERQTDLALAAAELIDAQPDFEIAVRPQSNIVCFRLTDGLETASLELRKRLLDRGDYFVTHTVYRGGSWLRLTLMHPQTDLDDIRGLLKAVRELAGVSA